MIDLGPICARLAAATPGKWTGIWPTNEDGVALDLGADCSGWVDLTDADVAFICNAKSDVAALLAEVDRLHGQITQLQTINREFAGTIAQLRAEAGK